MDEKLTPQEIQALVASGELTVADLKLLDKQEQRVAFDLLMTKDAESLMPMIAGMGGSGMAVEGATNIGRAMAGGLKGLASHLPSADGAIEAGKAALPGVVRAAGWKMGMPMAGGGLASWLQARFGRPGAARPAGLGGAGRGPKLPSSPPAEMSATGGQGSAGPRVMNTGATPKGFSLTAPKPAPRGPDITRAKSMEDVAERVVDRGVKVEGLGAGPAYTPNVDTQTSLDEILELILRSSSTGSPSPLMFHSSAPAGMRSAVDGLKRQVSRRSPG
jgi:hypothetical protein